MLIEISKIRNFIYFFNPDPNLHIGILNDMLSASFVI